MNKRYLLACMIALVGCSSELNDATTEGEANAPVVKEEKSLEFDFMDTTANPADDFYQYANGQWLEDNPIPEEESRWSSFNAVSYTHLRAHET